MGEHHIDAFVGSGGHVGGLLAYLAPCFPAYLANMTVDIKLGRNTIDMCVFCLARVENLLIFFKLIAKSISRPSSSHTRKGDLSLKVLLTSQ